jgi:hypothetical protein
MIRQVFASGLLVAALAAGCGDDGGGGGGIDAPPPGTPIRVAGGGVTTPGISGALHVFVVDALTDTPLPGATVLVEAATPLEGVTDAAGLVTFRDGGLSGPQTITAIAADRTTTTWVGAAGTDVTIPLPRVAQSVSTAIVRGTIAGWNNLPAPSFDHYNLGLVLATFTDDIGAPENSPPQVGGGSPANTCVRSALSNMCAWTLVARTGPQLHFAVIVDGATNGTTDVADDTYTLIGYAVGTAMTLSAGQEVNGESLTIVPAGELTNFASVIPAAPGGLGDVIAIPTLDLGEPGRIVFPLPTVTPARPTTRVLSPTGRFAGTYDVVALATPPGASAMPYSTTFTRGVTPASVTLGAWHPTVTQVAMNGRTGSFTATGPVRYASIRRADRGIVWSVSLLDGASTFTLPARSPDPLPAGALTLEITAAELPAFDAGNFRVTALSTTLTRASGASAAFVH